MTPLEKAKAEADRVNYCDECGHFTIVGNGAFCKVDGKLIHPIMLVRGQGTGPAWNCKKRIKQPTNYDQLQKMSAEELAVFQSDRGGCPPNDRAQAMQGCAAWTKPDDKIDETCRACWLDYLKREAE